jgi:hypothetical protein
LHPINSSTNKMIYSLTIIPLLAYSIYAKSYNPDGTIDNCGTANCSSNFGLQIYDDLSITENDTVNFRPGLGHSVQLVSSVDPCVFEGNISATFGEQYTFNASGTAGKQLIFGSAADSDCSFFNLFVKIYVTAATGNTTGNGTGNVTTSSPFGGVSNTTFSPSIFSNVTTTRSPSISGNVTTTSPSSSNGTSNGTTTSPSISGNGTTATFSPSIGNTSTTSTPTLHGNNVTSTPTLHGNNVTSSPTLHGNNATFSPTLRGSGNVTLSPGTENGTFNGTQVPSFFPGASSPVSSPPSASAPSGTPAPSSPPVECFWGETKVKSKQFGDILMKDTQIGMEVQVAQGVFEPILYYCRHKNEENGRRDDNVQAKFITLRAGKTNITLSANHFIPILRDSSSKAEEIIAQEVRIGDVLLGETGTIGAVDSITTAWRKGAYMPITKSGTILVNGVVASCHANPTQRSVVGVATSLLHVIHTLLPLSMYSSFAQLLDHIIGALDPYGGIFEFKFPALVPILVGGMSN